MTTEEQAEVNATDWTFSSRLGVLDRFNDVIGSSTHLSVSTGSRIFTVDFANAVGANVLMRTHVDGTGDPIYDLGFGGGIFDVDFFYDAVTFTADVFVNDTLLVAGWAGRATSGQGFVHWGAADSRDVGGAVYMEVSLTTPSQPTAVPAPPAFALMLAGLAAGAARRTRRRIVAA